MQTLSGPECKAWWSRRFGRYSAELDAEAGAPPSAKGHLNTDTLPAAQTRFVARAASHWLREGSPMGVLLWIQECRIWPSSEDWNLYAAWKRARGSRDPLEQTPGHRFDPDEHADLESLVFIALAFGWGWLGVVDDGSRALRLNHDGHIQAIAHTQEAADRIVRGLTS